MNDLVGRLAGTLALVALVFLAAACTSGSATTTLTAADSGRTVELRTGDELVLTLDGNPTTGFDWTVISPASASLELLERTFTPQSTLLGAGGTVLYRFRAAAEGSAKLTLNYQRSFESKPPERFFEVSVAVRPR